MALHFLCIILTFLVSSYNEILFLFIMFLTISVLWSLWSAKKGMSFKICIYFGTSFYILLMILISMLLIYSFKHFDWADEFALRSLVIGWLPPSSEASMLTFNSFETILSFLMKVEWEWTLRFFGRVGCDERFSVRSKGIFFQFGTVQDVICPTLVNFWLFAWLLDFLLGWLIFPNGCWTLLLCALLLLSFLKADISSWSVTEGPSVLILLYAKSSGVRVFLTGAGAFFFVFLVSLRLRGSLLFLWLFSLFFLFILISMRSQWGWCWVWVLCCLWIFLAGSVLRGLSDARLYEMLMFMFWWGFMVYLIIVPAIFKHQE